MRLAIVASSGSSATAVTTILSRAHADLAGSTRRCPAAVRPVVGAAIRTSTVLRHFLFVSGAAAVPFEMRIARPMSPPSSVMATAMKRLPTGS